MTLPLIVVSFFKNKIWICLDKEGLFLLEENVPWEFRVQRKKLCLDPTKFIFSFKSCISQFQHYVVFSPSLTEAYFQDYPRNFVIHIRKDIHWNCSWKIEDIPGDIPRNIRNNFLKNNNFNYDSFALENKRMITKDIPSNIPRNIRNNFLKNNTFNYDSFL